MSLLMNNEPRVSVGSELSITESELLLLVRPSLSTFDWDCPNYYRWYECGGNPRAKPLDRDELTQQLIHQGFRLKDANESASRLTFCNERAVWNALDAAGRISHEGGTTVTWSNGKHVLAEW